MKKQTAIQELVEIFEEMRSPFYNGSTIDVALAISLMKSMLEKEKEMLAGVWLDAQVAYQGDEYIKPSDPTFDEYYEETFNTK